MKILNFYNAIFNSIYSSESRHHYYVHFFQVCVTPSAKLQLVTFFIHNEKIELSSCYTLIIPLSYFRLLIKYVYNMQQCMHNDCCLLFTLYLQFLNQKVNAAKQMQKTGNDDSNEEEGQVIQEDENTSSTATLNEATYDER